MRWAFAIVLSLAGCATPPAPGSSTAPLRIASWNMEHLAEANDSGCRFRTDADYAAMRTFADNLNADVIAFQEVQSAAAAARVFDPARYQIVIEERQGSVNRLECQGLPGRFLNRQATGFAIRRGLAFDRNRDFVELQAGNADLRSAVDITLHPTGGTALRLLSVHLKSGCSSGSTNQACPEFLSQVPVLETWIDARASAGEAFAVLGDFNRRLAMPNDFVWADWNDANPPAAVLSLADAGVSAMCNPRYRDFIDHVVLGQQAVSHATQFREWTYSGEHLSDHCPVSIEWRR